MPQTLDIDDPGTRAPAAAGPEVLVAYATRYGSTRGVAERIAATLRDAGIRVTLSAADVAGPAAGYDAVVLGSPVYDQRWLPECEQFAGDNRGALAGQPVWLFSVGTFGDGKPLIGPLMRREPRAIGALLETIRPRDYRVFAGVIERRQWPLLSRLLYHALGGRLGDNRDWPAIDAWAQAIAAALTIPAPGRTGP
jgi:menaquinone-dependent protoporphyrinogen oxidase